MLILEEKPASLVRGMGPFPDINITERVTVTLLVTTHFCNRLHFICYSVPFLVLFQEKLYIGLTHFVKNLYQG
ncbi:MAG: hypothetical protein JETT_1375 [Candidatus Jettenia ecosi]|uniref:Uncharacterized protein n=1 Tax=Candidatus Jettenia ecosi TaxID=2494326 RepID=A0A533QC90_9BACT|nr:MAG: hypothetical protein JETT_1375 [Candidatus Jettenia ecosi]